MSHPADLRCPACGQLASAVKDSRGVTSGRKVRRRRHCLHCHARYRTVERIEDPAQLSDADADAILEDAVRLHTLVKARLHRAA